MSRTISTAWLLVTTALIPPPPSDQHTQVNHKDGDPANNRADNLEWVTSSQNIRHSFDTNAERKSGASKRSKPVFGRRYGAEGEWVEYASVNAAARALELTRARAQARVRARVRARVWLGRASAARPRARPACLARVG
mgnify:CR=1 FL=1